MLFVDDLCFIVNLDKELATALEHFGVQDPVGVAGDFSPCKDVIVDLMRSYWKRRYLAEEEVALACLSGRLAYGPYFIHALRGFPDY